VVSTLNRSRPSTGIQYSLSQLPSPPCLALVNYSSLPFISLPVRVLRHWQVAFAFIYIYINPNTIVKTTSIVAVWYENAGGRGSRLSRLSASPTGTRTGITLSLRQRHSAKGCTNAMPLWDTAAKGDKSSHTPNTKQLYLYEYGLFEDITVMKLVMNTAFLLLLSSRVASAFMMPSPRQQKSSSSLDMAQVGIFFGTSTGNTETAADLIYEAFGEDVAAEPIDVDELEAGKLSEVFGEYDALIVGTPTWNTGADTERSGTGWDELYYTKFPELKSQLDGKKVAVFGLGDQISYAENYADATGELHDVFTSLGCTMMGAWSQEGYEHADSKSIRGDKFCGLLLDMVNQEELSEERVHKWVAQLKDEGILSGDASSSAVSASPETHVVNGHMTVPMDDSGAGQHLTQSEGENAKLREQLEENSQMLDQSIDAHAAGGFTPHTNHMSGKTMWISQDGRQSYMTVEAPTQTKNVSP
jgi:flavodoxin I